MTRGQGPRIAERDEYNVWCYSNWMEDFVTSRWAVQSFFTEEEARDYMKNSERYHPERFTYHLRFTQAGAAVRL